MVIRKDDRRTLAAGFGGALGKGAEGSGQTVEYISVTGSDITVANVQFSDSAPGVNGVNVRGIRKSGLVETIG